MEAQQRIHTLFSKYTARTISEPEFDELLVWLYGLDLEQANSLSDSQKQLWEQAKAGQLSHTADQVNWGQVLNNVWASEQETHPITPVRRLWPRVAAAIFLLLLLGAGAFLLFNKNKKTELADNKPLIRQPESVLPNSNTTVLTLANGQIIYLDSVASGSLAQQGGVNVIKLQNGEIAYNNTGAVAAVEYHTISVPRGGRPYQLQLGDGSSIWLNAASTLRYPSAFVGKERKVELTGECYFEVAKNAAMPFHVSYNSMDVEVLGTHFNVMAYEDENSIQTTLLEGSVKVTNQESSVVIKPGQQSIVYRSDNNLKLSAANTELAVAWVKGYFQFDKADVKTILRQVGRWYDLDIEYRGKVSEDLFSGKIERNLPLTGIVKLLDQGKINVRVEGKKTDCFIKNHFFIRCEGKYTRIDTLDICSLESLIGIYEKKSTPGPMRRSHLLQESF